MVIENIDHVLLHGLEILDVIHSTRMSTILLKFWREQILRIFYMSQLNLPLSGGNKPYFVTR